MAERDNWLLRENGLVFFGADGYFPVLGAKAKILVILDVTKRKWRCSDEEDVSAEQDTAEENAWLPRANGDGSGEKGATAEAGEREKETDCE